MLCTLNVGSVLRECASVVLYTSYFFVYRFNVVQSGFNYIKKEVWSALRKMFRVIKEIGFEIMAWFTSI